MDKKTSTIKDLIDEENRLCLEAEISYGFFFLNALEFNKLLQSFIVRGKPTAWIFILFLSQLRKHHTLALLSTVRLHHIQAMMDLRQVLESGANAAFAIGNPDEKLFAELDSNQMLSDSEKLKVARLKWLEKEYPPGSDPIKNQKKKINEAWAHSSILTGFNNFKWGHKKQIETPFFDFKDDFLIKTSLWLIGNVALGLMDLFWGINQTYKILSFHPDFPKLLKDLEADNHRLKYELMNHKKQSRT